MVQQGLIAALAADPGPVVRRWAELYDASPIRLPGSYRAELVDQNARALLAAVANATPDELAPGSPHLRELEKVVAFLASGWASDRGSGFDLIALLLSGRDALLERADPGEREVVVRLFEWLVALATEAFGDAGARAERERQREALERGMPVTLVTPNVPAAFLLGEPDTFLFDGVFGRLLMLIVRVGARTAIVDATGLGEPAAPPAVVSLDRFLTHRKTVGLKTLFAVGLDAEAEQTWADVARRAGTALDPRSRFDDALARALEHTDYRLVRRPAT